MHLKRYKNFLFENLYDIPDSDEPWIFNSHFNVQPEMVTKGKFNRRMPDEVKGRFDCSFIDLTTLEGCPKIIHGDFHCERNKLTNLEHCPLKVGGSFYCSSNKLTSLKGCPDKVGTYFSCDFNKLRSLEYSPIIIGSAIDHDKNLVDLNIETIFILSGKYNNKSTYWIDLLKWMIDEKISLDRVKGWPKGFLTDELIQSVSGISKFNLFEKLKRFSTELPIEKKSWENDGGDKYILTNTELKVILHYDEFDEDEDEFDEEIIDPISNKSYRSNYEIFLDDVKNLSQGLNDYLLEKIEQDLLEENVLYEFDFSKGKRYQSTGVIFKIDFKATLEKLLKEDPDKIYTIDWPEDILPKDKKEKENAIQSLIGIQKFNL